MLCATTLIAVAVSATTTFTFTSVDPQTKDGFTVELSKADGQAEPSANNQQGVVRLYTGNTITITSTAGKITSLSIKFAKGKTTKDYASATANTGTYVSGGTSTSDTDYKTDTWTGEADQVVITLGGAASQRSIHELVVNGESSGTDDPQPTGNTNIVGLTECMARYYSFDYEDEDGGVTTYAAWDFDLDKDWTKEGGYVYPELYMTVLANSKTALNGTYDLLYACVWTSETDSVELSEADDAVATLTIKNTDNNGNYAFTGSFTGTDGKVYTFNATVVVEAYDDDEGEYITLNEAGGSDPEPQGDFLTCAEAATIAAKTGYKGTDEVTVVGYVTELDTSKVDSKTGRTKQSFYMSDTKGGAKDFMAYWTFVPALFKVGDRVQVTGILQNYKGTIEIADGEATSYMPSGLRDAVLTEPAVKYMENGQLYIRRNNKTYMLTGVETE